MRIFCQLKCVLTSASDFNVVVVLKSKFEVLCYTNKDVCMVFEGYNRIILLFSNLDN